MNNTIENASDFFEDYEEDKTYTFKVKVVEIIKNEHVAERVYLKLTSQQLVHSQIVSDYDVRDFEKKLEEGKWFTLEALVIMMSEDRSIIYIDPEFTKII